MLNHADYTVPARQRELDHADQEPISALKDLHHDAEIDNTDHYVRGVYR